MENGLFQYIVWESLFSLKWVKWKHGFRIVCSDLDCLLKHACPDILGENSSNMGRGTAFPNIACAPNEDSDQPAHQLKLINLSLNPAGT